MYIYICIIFIFILKYIYIYIYIYICIYIYVYIYVCIYRSVARILAKSKGRQPLLLSYPKKNASPAVLAQVGGILVVHRVGATAEDDAIGVEILDILAQIRGGCFP